MVPGDDVRPIGDRPKEALFNILGPLIQDTVFLDMFAGTGSVGIEALSRGAAQCVFLDTNRQAIHTTQANLDLAELRARALVFQQDAFHFIEFNRDRKYEFVFIAPPQYRDIWKKAVLAIDRNHEILQPDAWIICQMHPDEYEEVELKVLTLFDQRRYGNTLLVFYEYPGQ
jgi:16S rRNA (guanine(966)-N(2))-methyltransferase RsmD